MCCGNLADPLAVLRFCSSFSALDSCLPGVGASSSRWCSSAMICCILVIFSGDGLRLHSRSDILDENYRILTKALSIAFLSKRLASQSLARHNSDAYHSADLMPRRVLGYQPRILWPKSTAFLLGGAVLICLLGTQSHLSYLDLGPDVPIGWQAGGRRLVVHL